MKSSPKCGMTFQLLRGLSVSHRPRWLFEEDTLPGMPDERVETGCIAFICISEVRGMLRCADAQKQGVYVSQFLCYSGFSHAHGRSEFRSSPFPFSQALLQYVSTASLFLPIVVLHPPTSKKRETKTPKNIRRRLPCHPRCKQVNDSRYR